MQAPDGQLAVEIGNPDQMARAVEIARGLAAPVASLTGAGQTDLAITASFGLACYQADETLSQMTERADEALYRAKHAGRNRVMLAQGEAIR